MKCPGFLLHPFPTVPTLLDATSVMQAIAWANKSCDIGYPDTCLLWAGFLAKLAIYYDRVSDGHADVAIMNRVSCAVNLLSFGAACSSHNKLGV